MENNKTANETNEDYAVRFGKPFNFEGETYEGLDLSGLEKLTIRDAVDAQRSLFAQQEVAASLVCERTTAFAMELAEKATGKPAEFFRLLPRGEGRKIRSVVQGYINSGKKQTDGESKYVMVLNAPYDYKWETYTEFDFSGAADLTIMQETMAENTMARNGFVITENTFNYLYACIVAGMATGKETELFTGLPLAELMNLREAVNNSDFFV